MIARPGDARARSAAPPSFLQEGWVIANHILVSFHVAFISSVLALPDASFFRAEVLRFIFTSPETLVSALFMYTSFHTGIAVHEMGHFLSAARLNALNESLIEEVQARLRQPLRQRLAYYARLFVLAPYGRAAGIKREGLNYYPDAPYNLAVAAAGPRVSRNLAALALPLAILLLATGLRTETTVAIYAGRLLLGIGIIGLLDFLLADRGKYREFVEREKKARQAAATVAVPATSWLETAPRLKRRLLEQRLQEADHPRLGRVTAPWQFRNCGMGGRHTEKEYPESNVSMQEAMFLILGAADFQEAQEMTVRLQNRLKEIIESEPGCRVMGIGLEGGLAPYVDRGDMPLPEVRLWALMKRAIQECGFQPGTDVAIALDPAMSELEIAYRDEFNMPDAVGQYLFWRDKTKIVLDRDGVLDIYEQAMRRYDIPILSIEDGFSENDHDGWKKLLAAYGDRLFIIGDDLVTTNDRTIEMAASQGLINTALIKANQIGSLYETLLAMLVALGKGLELVVSHRSKSPNDDMEGQIALAANALGLKCGGGANTERLVKYQAVASLMRRVPDASEVQALRPGQQARVQRLAGYEEPTNAGIPTVGAEAEIFLPESGIALVFKGATPLGTSAGTGEAIHLVDTVIEEAEHREVVATHAAFFEVTEPHVYAFKKGTVADRVRASGDEALVALFKRAQRYQGKGCLNAVDNIRQILAPYFTGTDVAPRSIRDIDAELLRLELRTARRRGKVEAACSDEQAVRIEQRKQNLGMNAMLSVSLALGRAVAHVQGKQLYELLRAEMLAIIESLAHECDVPITGSQFADYVRALQAASRALEARGTPLYTELRRLTGVYGAEEPESAPRTLPRPASADRATVLAGAADEPAPAAAAPPAASPPAAAVPHEIPLRRIDVLDDADHLTAMELATCLAEAFDSTAREPRQAALRRYLAAREELSSSARRFEIVNNRLLRAEGRAIVPYRFGDTIALYGVRDGHATIVGLVRRPHGAICTDALLARLAGITAVPPGLEAIDLEAELFDFDVDAIEEIRIARIRDMADLLATVNACTNVSEATYRMRFLVAGLSSLSYKAFVGAKNLQPEVRHLMQELALLLNGPHAMRLRFLARILVRNLSSLVFRPNLIDQIWNDAIDLAEVQVRGSNFVNELRRSSHHALGQRTLRLAQAYLAYLETGDMKALAALGFEEMSPADVAARHHDVPRLLVSRMVASLDKLLGTSETVTRIEEWCDAYAAALVRCDFGNSLTNEMETLVEQGVRARNRWVYFHHLRIVAKKLEDFRLPREQEAAFAARLRDLEQRPPAGAGDVEPLAAAVRSWIEDLVRDVQGLYQDELFRDLRGVLDAHRRQAFAASFEQICHLRRAVYGLVQRGGFTEQRSFLIQLDCLLEEMSYLALQRLAAHYETHGVDSTECLTILRRLIVNLEYSGFASRELADLGGILGDDTKTHADLVNVLDHVQRLYHKVLQRATGSYEVMAQPLQLDAEELVVLLGNLKRYMHDLNMIAQYSDIARAHLRLGQPLQTPASAAPAAVASAFPAVSASPAVRVSPDPNGSLTDSAAHHAPAHGPPAATVPVLHISHRDEVRHLLAAGTNLRDLYGGKGSGLLYIGQLGIPTRDGFILPTTLARAGLPQSDPDRIAALLVDHLHVLEQDIARVDGSKPRFGAAEAPLLLAVRGGAVFSMPGMLSTVVFVGMNDRVAATLAERDPWQAYDAYRRFLASYAAAVWDVDVEDFGLVDAAKERHRVRFKEDLPWEAMQAITAATCTVIRDAGHGEELEAILAEPLRQLRGAVLGVFRSWQTPRARRYRELKGIADSWQTAVIVQQMASGNRRNPDIGPGMDETNASLTGVVAHTRVTTSGLRRLEGEIKFSAAGDDLVGGLISAASLIPITELQSLMPMLDRRMKRVVTKLRRFMGTDQEIEFTVEQGVLSVLQTRMAETTEEQQVQNFAARGEAVTRGIGVRGGGFRGLIAFDAGDVQELAALDFAARDDVDGVLLVLENPTPDDIPLILTADALLTAKGGSTSHAAVAVNGIDTKEFCAVLGATGLRVREHRREAVLLDTDGNVRHRLTKGDVLSLHGTSGDVYLGSLPLAKRA